jgi:recombination protein RecA
MAKKPTFEDELISNLTDGFKNKAFGTASASYLGDSSTNVTDYISTGSHLMNVILSNRADGGLPVGRLIEIAGGEGSGKSLLASYAMAETQRRGGVAILIDTEHAASMEVLNAVGVDVKKLVHIQAGTIEEVFKTMEIITNKLRASKNDKPITIVWDSVAATSSKAEVEGDYGQATVAMAARLLSAGLRKYVPICSQNNVCLIFINQLRTKIGVTFGDNQITPGGKAIPFHASIRLRLKHIKELRDGNKNLIGRIIKVDVKKNKIASPGRTMEYYLAWGSKPGAWIDEASTLFAAAEKVEIITNKTSQTYQFTFPSTGEVVEFTRKTFVKMFEEETFRSELEKSISNAYIITADNISDIASIEDAEGEDG